MTPLATRLREKSTATRDTSRHFPHPAASLPAPAGNPDVAPAVPSREIIALNRLAYGPRPGDPSRLKALGFESWLERQLHPDDTADTGLQARLSKAVLHIEYDAGPGYPA